MVLNGDRRVGDRLPCGTDLEDLLDQVADGHSAERSTHQLTCAYCQSALDEIERLWEPVRRLAGERVVAPPDSWLPSCNGSASLPSPGTTC